jgi:hypothetical protein
MESARVLQRHRRHGTIEYPVLSSDSPRHLSNLTAARVSEPSPLLLAEVLADGVGRAGGGGGSLRHQRRCQ